MKKVQNTLLVLTLCIFLNANYVNAEVDAPPSLPPLPILPTKQIEIKQNSIVAKQVAQANNSAHLSELSANNKEQNSLLMNSVMFYFGQQEDLPEQKQNYNPALYSMLDSLHSFDQDKRASINKFLKTNFKTQYLASEMFNKENSHLAKPIYMS